MLGLAQTPRRCSTGVFKSRSPCRYRLGDRLKKGGRACQDAETIESPTRARDLRSQLVYATMRIAPLDTDSVHRLDSTLLISGDDSTDSVVLTLGLCCGPDVQSASLLRRESDPVEQLLETRIGTKVLKAGVDLEKGDPQDALFVGPFKPLECLIDSS